jgi:hypothetical protein
MSTQRALSHVVLLTNTYVTLFFVNTNQRPAANLFGLFRLDPQLLAGVRTSQPLHTPYLQRWLP